MMKCKGTIMRLAWSEQLQVLISLFEGEGGERIHGDSARSRISVAGLTVTRGYVFKFASSRAPNEDTVSDINCLEPAFVRTHQGRHQKHPWTQRYLGIIRHRDQDSENSRSADNIRATVLYTSNP